MIKKLSMTLALSSALVAGMALAKPLNKKFGTTENGKVPEQLRQQISQEIKKAQEGMTQDHYEAIIADPSKARTDEEKLAGLSAREIFILVDRSGSMNHNDENPTGAKTTNWTRWDSARVAAESIAEMAISFDADNKVEIVLWDGSLTGKLETIKDSMTDTSQIAKFFRDHTPKKGNTPLAEALDDIYQTRLQGLLKNGEPFTVLILTDGAPNNPNAVKAFFKKVIKDNNLEAVGRETLAGFSFVRMGDDEGAANFLQELDDNLIQSLGVSVDIVDTKEDNFLFGTGKYSNKEGVGPFALFWDAIYD